MPHVSIVLKRAVILFSIIWAMVVLFFVWTILTIDPRDVSISPSALINASGQNVAQQIIAFLVFAFGVWAIPSSIAWQLSKKVQRSPVLVTGFVALFALVVYLLFQPNPLVSPAQTPDAVASSLTASESAMPVSESGFKSWQCKNDLEINCSNKNCQVEASFTAMSVQLNAAGAMSVCAYTGCWEGVGEVKDSGKFLIFIGNNLAFSTNDDPDAAANIVIVLDRTDNVATLKAGGFAQPMLCEQSLGD